MSTSIVRMRVAQTMTAVAYLLLIALAGVLLEFAPLAAYAQSDVRTCGGGPDDASAYPVKAVRWIAPFAPGGANDIVSRVFAQKLAEKLGQPFVVDNRPGAGGTVGAAIAAKAEPDGYTMIAVPVTHTTSPSLYANLSYDPMRDFAPVTMLSSSPLVLVVHPSLPVSSVKEFIEYTRARPGKLNYASSGIGAGAWLAAELFKTDVRVDVVHVPYKGQSAAMVDLITGRVPIMFPNVPTVLPHIMSRRLRALAVTTLKRTAILPELPTMAESGLPGFEVNQWAGLLVPARTPKPIVELLYREIVSILALPEVRASFASQGSEPIGNTPREFCEYIEVEIAKWAKLLRAAGIHAK